MKWWSSLQISDKYDWYWCNDLPMHYPILFYGKYKFIGREFIEELKANDDKSIEKKIGLEATIKEVKQNLDNIGLSIDFLVSFYNTYRITGIQWYLEGLLSIYTSKENENLKKVDSSFKRKAINSIKALKIIRNPSPQNEITKAINCIKANKHRIFSSDIHNMKFDLPQIDNSDQFNGIVENEMVECGLLGMFIKYIKREFYEIGDLLEIRLLLESLDENNSHVFLDLSDYCKKDFGDDDVIDLAVSVIESKVISYKIAFEFLFNNDNSISRRHKKSKLIGLFSFLLQEKNDTYKKGKLLEEFIATLFSSIQEISIAAVNLKLSTQELDIILKNKSNNRFFISLNSPFWLVECKNWKKKIGVKEIRVLESKMKQGRYGISFFISLKGFSKPSISFVDSLKKDGIVIILISIREIEALLTSLEFDVELWLEQIIENQMIKTLCDFLMLS